MIVVYDNEFRGYVGKKTYFSHGIVKDFSKARIFSSIAGVKLALGKRVNIPPIYRYRDGSHLRENAFSRVELDRNRYKLFEVNIDGLEEISD